MSRLKRNDPVAESKRYFDNGYKRLPAVIDGQKGRLQQAADQQPLAEDRQ